MNRLPNSQKSNWYFFIFYEIITNGLSCKLYSIEECLLDIVSGKGSIKLPKISNLNKILDEILFDMYFFKFGKEPESVNQIIEWLNSYKHEVETTSQILKTKDSEENIGINQ